MFFTLCQFSEHFSSFSQLSLVIWDQIAQKWFVHLFLCQKWFAVHFISKYLAKGSASTVLHVQKTVSSEDAMTFRSLAISHVFIGSHWCYCGIVRFKTCPFYLIWAENPSIGSIFYIFVLPYQWLLLFLCGLKFCFTQVYAHCNKYIKN